MAQSLSKGSRPFFPIVTKIRILSKYTYVHFTVSSLTLKHNQHIRVFFKMTAHATTTTAPSTTSRMTEARNNSSVPLSKFECAPAPTRAQLNDVDTKRTDHSPISNPTILLTSTPVLNILITYQIPVGTKHWEASDPCEEIETLRQKTDSLMEKFKTQTSLELAKAELAKAKLSQESKKPVEVKSELAGELDEGMGKCFRKVEQMKIE